MARLLPATRGVASPLGYQLVPALGAPTCEHLASVLGRHARTKPVSALATHFARLIGTLGCHCRGLRGSEGWIKKGGKAKPLSAKVSIRNGGPAAARRTLESLQRASRSV